MRQKVARVFYTNTGTSDKPEFGEPLLDVIERQWVAREITAEQYTEDKRMFATTYYSSDTENTMVDPRTGEEVQQVVVNEETGETAWPEGSIPELQFWINAMGPIADGVYSALLLSASKMVDRKRI